METKAEARSRSKARSKARSKDKPQVNTSIYTIPKGLMWLLRPKRRYTSNKGLEWIVEWLLKGILVFWAIMFVRAVIILVIGTMRHFGVIG